MIDVDDWAEIRRLHFAEELGIKRHHTAVGGPPMSRVNNVDGHNS